MNHVHIMMIDISGNTGERKDMERLTARAANLKTSAVNQMGHNYIQVDDIDEAMEKLSRYEDAGLEPEEIPVLLDRVKRATEQWNTWCDAYQKDISAWIPVVDRLPTENEYRAVCSAHSGKPFLRRLEIAFITDTTEYQFGYFDGYKWIDKSNKEIPNVVAWKKHEPYNPQN